MKRRDWLFWLVALIAAGTVLAGAAQLVAPRAVLALTGAARTDDSAYFFAIVGMFMAIVGALVLHALFHSADHPIVVLWAAVQKLGASAAVGVGVLHERFAPLALAVAAFDLVSGILMLGYLTRLRGASEP